MFRKNVLPNVKKDVSQSWQVTPDRTHEFYSWCAKEAPDASRLPITIFKKERENSLSLIRKIEIDELVIRVTRRILHDWEENLTSFDHIDCVEHVTDHRWMGVWFTVDLIHPNHGKNIRLYQLSEPDFDVFEFMKTLADLIDCPMNLSKKIHRIPVS